MAGTSPADWTYVSEGINNIIFSYTGPHHAHFSGTVLRVRKATRPCSTSHPVLDSEQDCTTIVAFQQNVIERLIPSTHLPRLEVVQLGEGWLEALAARWDEMRPPERRKVDRVDVSATEAIQATDLVGNGVLVVEIKPKWSFLPSPVHLSEASRSLKSTTCRFCMHSYLRHRNGGPLREYCPLDLFSGDRDRIRGAVRALWNDWVCSKGSINNLKIFLGGKFIKPDENSLHALAEQLTSQNISDLGEKFTHALVPLLVKTPILSILSKLQRSLDPLDIEGLSELARRVELESTNRQDNPQTFSLGTCPAIANFSEPGISDWDAFVDTYLSSHEKLDHSAPATWNWRYYVLSYILSAVFKDCSLIIRLDQDANAISVVDLGPKSITRFGYWEALDKEVVQTCIGVEGKKCVDNG